MRELLDAAGIANAADPARGYDHGTFIPLKLTYPDADVPAIQLSLKHGLDPAEHIALGRALMPLRDEDVFIIGSGMTFHNLRAFRDPRAAPVAETFDGWLRESMTLDAGFTERAAGAMGVGARGSRRASARRASDSVDGGVRRRRRGSGRRRLQRHVHGPQALGVSLRSLSNSQFQRPTPNHVQLPIPN